MYALTIKQPWATFIIDHGKDVENRGWQTFHRGLLLVHAGKRDDPDGFERARELGIILPDDLPRGGIIGKVHVIGCVQDSTSRWAVPGQWHWLLANPRGLPFEPMRGQLGLFRVGPAPQQTLDVGGAA